MTNELEKTNLCKEVCEEFKALGFKLDIDPRTLKESYNISKQADGSWFKNTKPGLHENLTKSILNLLEMPVLLKLTNLIDELDLEFKKLGGRIFITESLVYKIKKGTEYPIIINDAPTETKSKLSRYGNVCAEILDNGYERDRFRTEETYIISKASNGEWSMSSTHENLSGIKKILNLAKMPNLKILASKINKSDPVFESNGGRIFVTPMRVYRIKNKIEMEFYFEFKK
ncbi:MAG: hypothetical protein H7281_06165 [Bacteriovorax sp.]|nr:hypothetical protein [Bacteriovorax sp.]